jgi:hypothetical protein
MAMMTVLKLEASVRRNVKHAFEVLRATFVLVVLSAGRGVEIRFDRIIMCQTFQSACFFIGGKTS